MGKFFKNVKIKKYKDAIALFAVIAISVLLYILSVNGFKSGGLFSNFINNSLYNAYKVADYPIGVLEKLYANYLNLLSLKRDNSLLKARIKIIKYKLDKYKAYRIENEKLKALLFLKDTIAKKSIPATVTLHGIEGWLDSFYINKGKKDGVKVGEGVISYSGIVGRVVYDGNSRSEVIPVTNPKCVVSVVDANTGTLGIAQGFGDGYLKMRFVFNSQKVNVGDEILTSGLGGIFTSGIKVGKVFSVKKKGYKIFQRITIVPHKNLFNAKHVLVEE
ncbi:MAG: rod shape-determining protein MreC [Deltaproteobacteria bacterium]|nr:rod shape-determining protein MreC [Deltaproteobacteria bacterium]